MKRSPIVRPPEPTMPCQPPPEIRPSVEAGDWEAFVQLLAHIIRCQATVKE